MWEGRVEEGRKEEGRKGKKEGREKRKGDESWSLAFFPWFATCYRLFPGKQNLRWELACRKFLKEHSWNQQQWGSEGCKIGQKLGYDTVSVRTALDSQSSQRLGWQCRLVLNWAEEPLYVTSLCDQLLVAVSRDGVWFWARLLSLAKGSCWEWVSECYIIVLISSLVPLPFLILIDKGRPENPAP